MTELSFADIFKKTEQTPKGAVLSMVVMTLLSILTLSISMVFFNMHPIDHCYNSVDGFVSDFNFKLSIIQNPLWLGLISMLFIWTAYFSFDVFGTKTDDPKLKKKLNTMIYSAAAMFLLCIFRFDYLFILYRVVGYCNLI